MIENPTFDGDKVAGERTSLYGSFLLTEDRALVVTYGDNRTAIRILDEEKVLITKFNGDSVEDRDIFVWPLEDQHTLKINDTKSVEITAGRMLDGVRNFNFTAPLEVDVACKEIPSKKVDNPAQSNGN